MTVTPTYDSTLSRVRIAATGLASAPTALVERSTDQISWTTVRGGTAVPVSGGACALDDYEFAADVTNFYRVTAVSAAALVSTGTAAHANNASVTPGLPAGHAAGDVLLLFAGIHNSGVGSPNTPSGYTLLIDMGNVRLFGKTSAGGGEAAPTVTFAGGATGPTSAQMCALRDIVMGTPTTSQTFDASSQNISYPALTVSTAGSLIIIAAWKRSNWTAVATLPGYSEIGDPTTFQGGIGQGLVWDWVQQTTATSITAGQLTVTGGSADVCRGGVLSFAPTVTVQTGSVTPTLTTAWLKSIGRPFLNTPVVPLKPVPATETEPRQGIFEVIGRSDPVARTDVRASKAYILRVLVETSAERDGIALVIDSGDPVYLHYPPTYPKPSMYAVIGSTRFDPFPDNPDAGIYTLPVRKVAAPGPDVVGSTATYQTVLDTYATYTAMIAATSTYADLLDLVADPSEVIVP